MSRQLMTRFAVVVTTAALLFGSVATVSGAVWTDQADYSPGSVVTVSGDNSNGAGYLAGETVDVAVSGPNGYAAACQAVVDDSGAWSCQVTLWDNELAVGDYTYTATGQTSGATESGTFKDNDGVAIDSASFAWHRTGEVPDGFNVPVSGTYTCNLVSANDCTVVTSLTIEVIGVAGSKVITGLADPVTGAAWGPVTLEFRAVPGVGQFAIPAADGKYNVKVTLDTDQDATDPTATANNYVGVDNTDPETDIQCDGAVCANPYPADVQVKLFPDDGNAATSSGVDSTVYCVDTTNTCTPGTGYPGGAGFDVTYVAGATYYVRFRSTDEVGNQEAVQSQAIVFAAAAPPNTPPSVDAAGPYSGTEGSATNIAGTASDPDSDPLTYLWTINYNGNIDPSGSCVFGDATALSTTVTCNDDSNAGSFTLTLTATGDVGGPVFDTATLTVSNVAPTVTLTAGNPVSVTESNTLERTYAYVAGDAGTNDTLIRTPDCGAAGGYVASSDNGSSFKCKFLDGGPTPPGTDSDVTIYVTDDEGVASTTATQTVNISNAIPVVAMPSWANATIDCQTNATLTGLSFSDAGINDMPWSMDIDWDDGGTTNVSPIATQGAQSNQSHLYTTPGTYDVIVDVTDKDGGVGNQNVATLTVEQTYTVRFLSPFDASSPYELVNNTMKAGRVVPVKVTIYDDCAQQYVTDPATLVKLHLGTNTSGPAGASDAVEVYADAGASNSNTLYFRFNADANRADGGFWIFNLDSRTALNGSPFVVNSTYRVDIYVGPSPGVLATDDEWALLKAVK